MRARIAFTTVFLLAGCATGEDAASPSYDAATTPPVDSAVTLDASDAASVDTALPDMGPVVTTGLSPHKAAELVSTGTVTKSPGYKMISNLGPTTTQVIVMKSEKYRALGGVVGATAGK